MAIERKHGIMKALSEGKALVRLATLLKVDRSNDVIEHGFFPTAPPLVVSIQPYHNHQTASLGHATVFEDAGAQEVLATFEFNDSLAAQEQWKVLKWDYEHGPIQEFSWAFRTKPGSERRGMFEGKSVRFLGPADDGSHGVLLMEAGPVLNAASVNTGTVAVRSQYAPLDRVQHRRAVQKHHTHLKRILARKGVPIAALHPLVQRALATLARGV